MKVKDVVNIFYFLTILNYILHYKINCFLIILATHIGFYFILNSNVKAQLLSIIFSMFLFCVSSINFLKEPLANECTDAKIDECEKDKDEVCIQGKCQEKICTESKKKECKRKNSTCSEQPPRGCATKNIVHSFYDLININRGKEKEAPKTKGFVFKNVDRDKYSKRVDLFNIGRKILKSF